MGNAQGHTGGHRRERTDSNSGGGGGRHHSRHYTDDECPVQVKIPKASNDDADRGNLSSAATLQYVDTTEFPVVLKWHANSNTKAVNVSGSWDGWKKKIPLVRSHDDFTTILNLPEGKHEYKFHVDGNWVIDTKQKLTDNGVGTQNNVVDIQREDFEVFEALDRDFADTIAAEAEKKGNQMESSGTLLDRDMMKNAPYTQDIPDRKDFEKAQHPPVLPPHLLQVCVGFLLAFEQDDLLSRFVILNKDTPVSADPNVLPEPNHVMLNHLYALSIKDGVMVLSATHRYRKKYVTTLLYRPIN